jgi:hypothetical protein
LILGIGSGVLVHTLFAAFGLSAVLATSAPDRRFKPWNSIIILTLTRFISISPRSRASKA